MLISEYLLIFVVVDVVVFSCKYNHFCNNSKISTIFSLYPNVFFLSSDIFDIGHFIYSLQNMKESEKADRIVDAKAIIDAVLKHVGMKAPTFAKEIGINYQRIFDLTSGRTKKFNPGVVNLICERFPEISKHFLYTGEGDIVAPNAGMPGSAMGAAQLSELMAMSRQLMNLFQTLSEKENRITEMLTELNERERELNEREHSLNMREIEVERIADEMGIKKDNIPMEA